MSKRPTLDEVARQAGVSRMTVSNTYSHPKVVAPSTRDRVLEAARSLGYPGPSPAGRSLRRGRSDVVGVVVADSLPYLFTDPGAAGVMQGMASEAAGRDLSLQVIHAAGPGAPDKVRRAIVDAWVLYGLPRGHPATVAAIESGQPLATISGEAIPRHPGVAPEEALAARLVVDHLVGLGHRTFTLVAPSLTSPIWSGRMVAYRAALPAQRPDSIRLLQCGENTREAGRSIASLLLQEPLPPGGMAVLAATDVLALGLLDVARERGIRVPQEVSVVGFDDIDEAAASAPALTTVHQDLQAQGRLAIQLATAGGRRRKLRHAMPVELVIRASTGPSR